MNDSLVKSHFPPAKIAHVKMMLFSRKNAVDFIGCKSDAIEKSQQLTY
jgi:hypothetical protein